MLVTSSSDSSVLDTSMATFTFEEQRVIIRFLHLRGMKPIGIHQQMSETCYDGVIDVKNVRSWVQQKWNLMAHTQKLDLVFQRNGRVHLYRRGCQFSRLLAAEVCGSAVVMLDRPCPIQCTTVLATPSIHLFPLHFSTHAFPCAIRFRFCSTTVQRRPNVV